MGRIVRDIRTLLLEEGAEASDVDWNHLWDDRGPEVTGGTNWSPVPDDWDAGAVIGFTGPEVPEAEVPF